MENGETSKYERIIKNLSVLESRNPDLGRFLRVFDAWLENFVTTGNGVAVSQVTSKLETAADGNTSVSSSVEKKEQGLNAAPAPVKKDVIRLMPQFPTANDALVTGGSVSAVSQPTGTAGIPSQNVAPGFVRPVVGSSLVKESGQTGESVSDVRAADASQNEPVKMDASTGGLWRNEDIDQLEKRLLLKIEASRWALERDRLLKNSVNFQTEIEPKDHNLLARARELTNCYLWMNNPETAPVIATETYEMLADAYAAAACCVGFMRQLIDLVDRSPKSEILNRILRDALYITATAQSALRRVTYDVSGREDQDQIRIHRWLTLLTKRYGIYVNRHMKKDSLAPKDRIYVIPDYIARLRKEVDKLGQRQKILTEGFRRIQYHASRMTSENGNDYDWNKIIETVDELVDAGIPANDERFKTALKDILPSLKTVPAYKDHPFFINVLMELDYWHENEAQKARVARELSLTPPQPKAASEPSPDEYTSVWDEMEREGTPAGKLSQNSTASTGDFPSAAEQNFRDPSKVSTPAYSAAGTVSSAFGTNGHGENRDSAFSGYSSNRKPHGFGQGILGSSDEREPKVGEVHGTGAVGAAPSDQPLRYVGNSTYSRLASGHQGIPSYASVVSEKAHGHYESGSAAESEDVIRQAQSAIQGKTLIFVDGQDDPELKKVLQEKLGGKIAFAGEEQIASEMKIAQLEHPGNVAVVLMVEGSVPTANRNVENYCRHFDKPLLRVNRELDINSVARQIVAAMTLWR
ncbi:MAG: hypothetical protein Q4A17_04670 [Thermoguttaceae bacterium]|nr:hypothetical protein [Thermoguttaceae bacterium]